MKENIALDKYFFWYKSIINIYLFLNNIVIKIINF